MYYMGIVVKIIVILFISIPAIYSLFKQKRWFDTNLWLVLAAIGLVVWGYCIITRFSILYGILDTVSALGYAAIILERVLR